MSSHRVIPSHACEQTQPRLRMTLTRCTGSCWDVMDWEQWRKWAGNKEEMRRKVNGGTSTPTAEGKTRHLKLQIENSVNSKLNLKHVEGRKNGGCKPPNQLILWVLKHQRWQVDIGVTMIRVVCQTVKLITVVVPVVVHVDKGVSRVSDTGDRVEWNDFDGLGAGWLRSSRQRSPIQNDERTGWKVRTKVGLGIRVEGQKNGGEDRLTNL